MIKMKQQNIDFTLYEKHFLSNIIWVKKKLNSVHNCLFFRTTSNLSKNLIKPKILWIIYVFCNVWNNGHCSISSILMQCFPTDKTLKSKQKILWIVCQQCFSKEIILQTKKIQRVCFRFILLYRLDKSINNFCVKIEKNSNRDKYKILWSFVQDNVTFFSDSLQFFGWACISGAVCWNADTNLAKRKSQTKQNEDRWQFTKKISNKINKKNH